MEDGVDMKRRFQACMVLAGVGDALGYGNGSWEFNPSGVTIHEEAKRLGGVENIQIEYHSRVSDDTVMHMATAHALVSYEWQDHDNLLHVMAREYIDCMRDMNGRAPGVTCSSSVRQLTPFKPKGYHIIFNPRGGGCGAAMRAAPIGLYYWRPEQIDCLLEVAIESGRMTHNHPTGYLGSLATALFVSYAVQKKPLREWGVGLMQTLPMAKEFIESSGRDLEENCQNWDYFETQWKNFLMRRKIEDGKSEPVFDYNDTSVKERDAFYKELSFDGTGGASGHDAPMIAYEALLGSLKSNIIDASPTQKRRQWVELCKRSMLHGGDSDSTGIIAAACWGAMEGFSGVPENHYKTLEYRDELVSLGDELFDKANAIPRPADESNVVVSVSKSTIDDLEQTANDTEDDVGNKTENSMPPEVKRGERGVCNKIENREQPPIDTFDSNEMGINQ